MQIDVLWFPKAQAVTALMKRFSKAAGADDARSLELHQRNYLRETVIKHPDCAEATRVWNFPYAAIEKFWLMRCTTALTKNASRLKRGSAMMSW